ncbi:nitrogen regulation protein NR(I) [Erythrobacter sp. QSSC1-22B]|uniref:nitrogen regulation protein NR(I) n=1 Tax=Erythrobacter sp. QSSC1-22B TaxID=1860125 RepID=UPI00080534EB|nr:nitrogen regulation protein NR(I) [Erythrobacter sp. QSSC1-22B]OBX20262.1 nitrogen regulation protein NR(I) [Erythrobacter sp. QSSC1-22B]
MTRSVLIVEDDPAIAAVIAEALGDEGYDVTLCSRIDRRDELLAERRFDVMLTDVILEDGDGLASIAAVHSAAPEMPVIVLSAQNTLDTAVRSSDSRAFEYFPKPFDLDELTKAVEQAAARRPSVGPQSDPAEDMPFIGRSQAMQGVYRMISRVLRNDLTVLVTGESGTGKELVAEAVHELGARKTGPFVAVNAAAIPHDLIESELFGHEKGAFTGAINQAIGKFEQANGGTLFLDEIGDMPAQAQTRLLRALQSGRIRRVGGRHDIAVDVRIIAATNRDLAPMIAEGTFREDLYYRLNVVPIHMPPLRERREDIAALARHFLALAEREGLPRRSIAEEAVAALAEREWPGNVRELRNVVFRLALIARNESIDRAIVDENLPGVRIESEAAQDGGFTSALASWLAGRSVPSGTLYHAALTEFEKPLIEHALRETEGNQVRAAQLLGINRNTLRKKIGELGIEPERYTRRR